MDRFQMVRTDAMVLRNIRIAIVHCLLAGYLPGAYFILMSSERETRDVLREALELDKDLSHMDFAFRINTGERLLFGFLGLSLSVLTTYLTTQSAPWDLASWSPEVVWHRLLGLWLGWWFGWMVLGIWRTSAHISRIGEQIDSIDILDLSPWTPFVQFGARTTLVLLGGVSLVLLFLIEPDQWPTVAIVTGLCIPLTLLGLWLPVRGVHARIREVKQVELVWVRGRIQQVSTQFRQTATVMSPGEIADLSAYLRLIEDVPEWPIEGSTLAQVLLYLLLPVASWLGSLLIENLLRMVFS